MLRETMKTLLEEAQEEYVKGNNTLAFSKFKELLSVNPNIPEAWYGLSMCIEDVSQKEYCLRLAINLKPDYLEAQNLLWLIKLISQGSLGEKSVESPELIGNNRTGQNIKASKKNHPIVIEQANETRGIYNDENSILPLIRSNNQNNTSKEKTSESSFPLRYVCAILGFIVILSTFLDWVAVITGNGRLLHHDSGLTHISGYLTLGVGVIILFSSLINKTIPGRRSAPFSAIVALISIVFILFGVMTFLSEPCFEAFFSDPDAICYEVGSGFGFSIAMISLVLISILGFLRNPDETLKNQRIERVNKDNDINKKMQIPTSTIPYIRELDINHERQNNIKKPEHNESHSNREEMGNYSGQKEKQKMHWISKGLLVSFLIFLAIILIGILINTGDDKKSINSLVPTQMITEKPKVKPSPTSASSIQLIGTWEDTWAIPQTIIVYTSGDNYYMESVFSDGTSDTIFLDYYDVGSERRFIHFPETRYGDYMVIRSDGSLAFYDDQGFIYSIAP